MKKKPLIAFALLCSLALCAFQYVTPGYNKGGGSFPTPTPVNGGKCNTGGTTCNLATAWSVVSGNVVIVTIITTTTGATLSVASTAGTGSVGSFTSACGPYTDSGTFVKTQIFWAKVTGSGTVTITPTVSSSTNFMAGAGEEYSGVNTTSPVDQCPTGNTNDTVSNNGTLSTGTTSTTTQTEELLIGGFGLDTAAGFSNNSTAISPFVLRQVAASGPVAFMEDQVVSSTGTYTATMTYSDNNAHVMTGSANLIVTFKAGS
jgi:hypothetical protein